MLQIPSPKAIAAQILILVTLHHLKLPQSTDWKPNKAAKSVHVTDRAVTLIQLVDLRKRDLEPEFAAVAVARVGLECRFIKFFIWLDGGSVLLLSLFGLLIGHDAQRDEEESVGWCWE